MKAFLKAVLLTLLVLVTAVALFLGIQSIRLKWWESTESVTLSALSAEEKAQDMRYLLDLTRRVSQADAVWQAAGLDNPLDQQETWIVRASETASNAEFVDLVLQYLVHLQQAGHASLAFDASYHPATSQVGDIPKDAFYKMPLWAEVTGGLAWYAHSRLDIVYRDGLYVLDREAAVGGVALPQGAVVESVDGLPADAFALARQYRTHLRFDPAHDKFFIFPLMGINPGPDRRGWDVTFRLPDGAVQSVFVAKIPGYVAHHPDESGAANVRCLALPDDVLYIRILTFYYEHAEKDAIALRDCFSPAGYRTAIFDVRGNSGGELWSYMDNVMAPLTRRPVTFEIVSAIKTSFYDWYGWHLWLNHVTHDNELTDPPAHVVRVEPVAYPPYSDGGWRVMRVVRRVEPAAEPFPFDGRAYVLVDNDTLSAGDSFASAMKQTGLAKVVGTPTTGWGQGYQAKMLYALPNSGLMFFMDSELTFNPDGTLNNFRGVSPDVALNESTYPTPYVTRVDKAIVLADPWVQWVLADTQEK